jgi:hypothetical protein
MSSEKSRYHAVMTALLYPAILGALIYEGLAILGIQINNGLFTDSHTVPFLLNLLLIVALIILYIYDFVYTVWDDEEGGYGKLKFTFDLLIVMCLYSAIKVTFNTTGVHINKEDIKFTGFFNNPLVWLIGTKVLATAWEFLGIYHKVSWDWLKIWESLKNWKSLKDFDFSSDFLLGIGYIVIYVLQRKDVLSSPAWILFWTLLVVLLDIYYYYDDAKRRASNPQAYRIRRIRFVTRLTKVIK